MDFHLNLILTLSCVHKRRLDPLYRISISYFVRYECYVPTISWSIYLIKILPPCMMIFCLAKCHKAYLIL